MIKMFVLWLLLFFNPVFAGQDSFLSKERIDDRWVVERTGQDQEVTVSVNGQICYGNRLRIRLRPNHCGTGNTYILFYTTKKNPKIANINNIIASAKFKNQDIKVMLLFGLKGLLGHFVAVDLGVNTIQEIKDFFKNEKEVKLIFKKDDAIDPNDYFDVMEEWWSLNGLNKALDNAQKECKRRS